ncbi:hypothetical protein CYMTET_26753 [Cymbomonas tetramitiformis]|uniref:DOMON domain-containing protein n=1 Tax=Cymbomonas tetramitiformis TaxID=36881 RepID=A0AAE0KXP6_9CHLO|nr:hypothetical protein CYMTET_26753 [Cymbomonas tetramitiformis]
MMRLHRAISLVLLPLLLPTKSYAAYYSFDGWGNNLRNPEWGMAGSELLRYPVASAYHDGISNMTGGGRLPDARDISVQLMRVDQISSKRRGTDFITYLGQLFDHDFDLNEHTWHDWGKAGEAAPIPIPVCDAWFDADCDGGKVMEFTRTGYNGSTPPDQPRQQINGITSFLDGSVVYGSSFDWASKLRTFRDGTLLVSDGNLLPWNIGGLPMANDVGREDLMFAAGDKRANVNPAVIALQVLFLRNHNRLAAEYKAANPTWVDEDLFNAARKWNVAQLQAICWYEYLPSLGLAIEAYGGYKEDTNPSIDNFFSTVAYRYGHSEVGDIVKRVDDHGMEIDKGHLLLQEAFFSPQIAMSAGIEPILRGLASGIQWEVDTLYSPSIQHFLFNLNGHGATDLLARNIQRGRDHGTPLYNRCRQHFGLSRKTSFREVSPDEEVAMTLSKIYKGNVDMCDAYVCGLAEEHVMNSGLGELFYASMTNQYTRTRDGDRFYFENPAEDGPGFTAAQISELKATHLRDLILLNTDVKRLPANIFFMTEEDPWIHTPEDDASAPSSPPQEADAPTLGDHSMMLHREGGYQLSWTTGVVDGTEDELEISISVSVPTTGWIGIGFENPAAGGSMYGADMVIGLVDKWGTAFVHDCYSRVPGVPPQKDLDIGGASDVYNIAGTFENGVTTISFSRKFVTEDTQFDLPIAATGDTAVIFSWQGEGSDDIERYHGSCCRGRGTSIEFNTEVEEAAPALDISEVAMTAYEAAAGVNLEYGLMGDSVVITMAYETEGYVAIGIDPSDGGMTNADMYVGRFEGGVPVIEDRYALGTFTPELDSTTQDATLVQASREGGITSFTFVRLLDTLDPDQDNVIEDRTMAVVWAMGSADSFDYHASRGKFNLNFIGGTEELDEDASADYGSDVASADNCTSNCTSGGADVELIDNHAMIMGLTWPLLCVMGVLIARFGRSWRYWLRVHRFIQTVVVSLSFVGQVFAFVYTGGSLETTHGATAIFIICFTTPQAVLGVLSCQKELPDFVFDPESIKRLHRVVGYLLTGFCLWQTYTGMEMYNVSHKYIQLFYAWLVALCVATIFSNDIITVADISKILKASTASAGGDLQSAMMDILRNHLDEEAHAELMEGSEDEEDCTEDLIRAGVITEEEAEEMAIKKKSEKQAKLMKLLSNASRKGNMGVVSERDRTYTRTGVAKLAAQGVKVTIIENNVYDLEELFGDHPGGDAVLTKVNQSHAMTTAP